VRGQRPEERARVRREHARALLEGLHGWMRASLSKTSAKSELAGAIRYAVTRWVALTRYVDDGRIEIDNNAAERALRAAALGRTNYLFLGSDAGASGPRRSTA